MKKVTQVHEQINEKILDDDYEFMTEKDMIDAGFTETLISNVCYSAVLVFSKRQKNNLNCSGCASRASRNIVLHGQPSRGC